MIVVFAFFAFIEISHGYKRMHWIHEHSSDRDNSVPSVKLQHFGAHRMECIADVQKDIVEVFRDYLDGPEVIGYADPAANGNLGDQLLWAGSNKLFQKFGKHPVFYCGGSQTKSLIHSCDSYDAKTEMKAKLSSGTKTPKGILWYNPGGNWGNLYRHVQLARFQVWEYASSLGIPFISGPQSIFYMEGSHAVSTDAELVKKIAKERDLLTFRQHNSYVLAAALYGNYATIREASDMAFMLGPQISLNKPLYDVFLLVRNDGESDMLNATIAITTRQKIVTTHWSSRMNATYNHTEYYNETEYMNSHDAICREVIQRGFSCGIGDWGTGKKVNRREGSDGKPRIDPTFPDIGLQMAMDTVSLGQLIVSDRLHGALLAFLAGKPVVYIDNKYKKLSNVFSTAFSNKTNCNSTIDVMGLAGSFSANHKTVVETIFAAIQKWRK